MPLWAQVGHWSWDASGAPDWKLKLDTKVGMPIGPRLDIEVWTLKLDTEVGMPLGAQVGH